MPARCLPQHPPDDGRRDESRDATATDSASPHHGILETERTRLNSFRRSFMLILGILSDRPLARDQSKEDTDEARPRVLGVPDARDRLRPGRVSCRRRSTEPRGRSKAPEHRLHLQRRSCLSGHQRLQRPAPADRDAPHRSPGQGRDALRPLRRAELDLRAQPCLGPDRQILPLQRLLQQHQQPVRRLADHVPQAAARRRLPDGDHRQVAPGHRPDRLRRVAHPAGPGRLLQPADDPQRPAGGTPGLYHRHHHRFEPRLAEGSRQIEAVPADVPAQGAAPRVAAGAAPPGPRRAIASTPSRPRSSTTIPAAARPSTTRT